MKCKFKDRECDLRCNEPITDCELFAPMTNADRIRQMTDEELAGLIMCPYDKDGDCYGKTCLDCCIDWLKQLWEGK